MLVRYYIISRDVNEYFPNNYEYERHFSHFYLWNFFPVITFVYYYYFNIKRFN